MNCPYQDPRAPETAGELAAQNLCFALGDVFLPTFLLTDQNSFHDHWWFDFRSGVLCTAHQFTSFVDKLTR